MGGTAATSPAGYDAAIFAAPHGTPYPEHDNRIHAGTAAALRNALRDDSAWIENWDFDFGGRLLGEKEFRLADLGDLETRPEDGPGNRMLIRECTKAILDAGAVPLMIGGDDSTPIPFIEAFASHAPLTILQIDAHIDWREERYGEHYGFSSTMRRASEMKHVDRIVQVGMRGIGSARRAEVDFAKAWGAQFVTSREVLDDGIAGAIAKIPDGARCLITVDCDALDSSVMPAVAYPTPGGLTYNHLTGLIQGVARKARIVGFDLIEFVPGRDESGMAAFTAARIVSNVIGTLASAYPAKV
ncbi:MAG: arginase family protein [Rhizobiales bacterium]|nr:arginase family protein [Hyphomicrobiales bacterium]